MLNGESRFEELLKFFEKLDDEITRPTLSHHLRHLVEMQLVKQKVIQKKAGYGVNYTKKISYIPDYKKIEKFKDFVDLILDERRELDEWKKTMLSKPVNEQFETVLKFLILRNLIELKTRISFKLNENLGDEFILLALKNDYFRDEESWVIQKCIDDDLYRKEVLERIDESMAKLKE